MLLECILNSWGFPRYFSCEVDARYIVPLKDSQNQALYQHKPFTYLWNNWDGTLKSAIGELVNLSGCSNSSFKSNPKDPKSSNDNTSCILLSSRPIITGFSKLSLAIWFTFSFKVVDNSKFYHWGLELHETALALSANSFDIIRFFLGLNLPLKNPTKTHENTTNKKKNPY